MRFIESKSGVDQGVGNSISVRALLLYLHEAHPNLLESAWPSLVPCRWSVGYEHFGTCEGTGMVGRQSVLGPCLYGMDVSTVFLVQAQHSLHSS